MGKQEGAGRPEITIDWDEVESLVKAGCSGIEVSAQFGIHHDTLYDRCVKEKKMSWSDYSAKMKAKGDILLHQKQFEVALEGDKTMLVWLGKQRLAQRDKFDYDHTTGGEKIGVIVLPQKEDKK
jgi:hypothetical protein